MILILLFGFVFNTPRWFEWELKLKEHFYFEVGNQTFFMDGDKRDFDEIYDTLGHDNPFNDTNPNQTNNEYDFDELHHNFGLHITWPNDTIIDTNGTMGNDTFQRHSEERLEVEQTSLLKNPIYFRYYSLIGSGIVMVIIPLAILLRACCFLRKAVPSGTQKHKILKIMTLIISMFVICHIPKVGNDK